MICWYVKAQNTSIMIKLVQKYTTYANEKVAACKTSQL